MGVIYDLLRLSSQPEVQVEAAAEIIAQPQQQWTWDLNQVYATRRNAMTIPAVARARNIICGTIGSLPLHAYGPVGRIGDSPLLYAPDPASPKAVTYTWLADSILFYGMGYTEILETYAVDGRPSRMRWVDPERVQPAIDPYSNLITGYSVDGTNRPAQGVGSIIAFPGLDEGLLQRAGRTIRTVVELEEAAYRAAQEPSPQVVLKNSGVDLPADRVTALLNAWKSARRDRSTAYLNNSIELDTVGFDPKSSQLLEARQFASSEIARAVGIPAWYLNAEAASMTYSNVSSERRALVDFSLRPILTAIEQRLSMPDITPRDQYIKFDLDDFLRGDPRERVEVIGRMLELGVISVEEARKMEDLIDEA